MTLVTAKNRCSGTRKVPLKKNNPTATAAAIPAIVPIHVCSPSLESSMARNTVHPYDHRNYEDRGDQQHQPFEAILVDAPALQGDRYAQAERCRRCNAVPDETRQMLAARAG